MRSPLTLRLARCMAVLAAALLASGCLGIARPVGPPRSVVVTAVAVGPGRIRPTVAPIRTVLVTPAGTPTPTPACTPLPSGMALTITPAVTAVEIEVTGLQPGERPVIVITRADGGPNPERIEVTAAEPVGESGRYSVNVYGLTPASPDASDAWHVQVLHARGAACQDITFEPAASAAYGWKRSAK